TDVHRVSRGEAVLRDEDALHLRGIPLRLQNDLHRDRAYRHTPEIVGGEDSEELVQVADGILLDARDSVGDVLALQRPEIVGLQLKADTGRGVTRYTVDVRDRLTAHDGRQLRHEQRVARDLRLEDAAATGAAVLHLARHGDHGSADAQSSRHREGP